MFNFCSLNELRKVFNSKDEPNYGVYQGYSVLFNVLATVCLLMIFGSFLLSSSFLQHFGPDLRYDVTCITTQYMTASSAHLCNLSLSLACTCTRTCTMYTPGLAVWV